jgi:myxalamid-type nonribosomal peptide synthetase MxaA
VRSPCGGLSEAAAAGVRARAGYSQSKWVSERMVEAAAERGLPVTVWRTAFIAGHSRTGHVRDAQSCCGRASSALADGRRALRIAARRPTRRT